MSNQEDNKKTIYHRVCNDIDSNKWWWGTCYNAETADRLVELLNRYEDKLLESTNEVARLRELLNRAIEALENLNSGQAFVKPQVLREELARLAPAPEEPVAVNSEPSSQVVDQKTQNVSDNERRELGPKEVARLREELQKLRLAAQAVVDRWETPAWKDAEPTASVIYRLRDALAPAPEEPVSKCRCNNPSIITATHNGETYEQCSKCGKKFKITMDEWYGGFSKIKSTESIIKESLSVEPEWRIKSPKEYIENGDEYERNYFWLPVPSRWVGKLVEVRKPKIRTSRPLCAPLIPLADLNQHNKENTPSLNEWRELGEVEVICEGDEVQPKHHVGGEWVKAWSFELGVKSGHFKAMRYRTRRPLPKQEEMPLEDEIETLWEHSEHIDSLTGHMAFKALAKSIRYLRDEIQRLKNETHYHHESYCRKCNEPK